MTEFLSMYPCISRFIGYIDTYNIVVCNSKYLLVVYPVYIWIVKCV